VLYRWRLNSTIVPYFNGCRPLLAAFIRAIRLLVISKPFDFAVYLIIISNGLLLGKED
jgi:hypothetical protein